MPITRSTGFPLASLRSSRRQASALRIISAGGYHLNGKRDDLGVVSGLNQSDAQPLDVRLRSAGREGDLSGADEYVADHRGGQ